ncbi:MAG: protein-export chaperone SecB [Bacteroidota bacterium]|nr:protein-export chaperone SecB [Bacteroidota bacterium]
MENINQLESGFKITNLILMECNFKREANVTFNNPDTKQELNVDVNVNVSGNIIVVSEQVDFKQIFNEIVEFSASIKMVGVFEKFGEAASDLEEFGQVNGAAIIFPYIREQLTNISSKAGLGLIILPPANFTKKK